MEESVKNQIILLMETLRTINVTNGVSMGFDKTKNSLMFFDTESYCMFNKFDGFSVTLNSLVSEKEHEE